MCSVCFCLSACLVTLPCMNILSAQSPEPTYFMYSILDYLLKFNTTNREIPATISIWHMNTLLCYTLHPMCYYSVYNRTVWKTLHARIISHQAHAYLETYVLTAEKICAKPPGKCIIIFVLVKNRILFVIIDFNKSNCRFTPDQTQAQHNQSNSNMFQQRYINWFENG